MEERLFPTDLPKLKWTEFPLEGFTEPMAGVIYRTACESKARMERYLT